MAIPPKGNFRIRAVLGWKEIDGGGVDLRALVKRRPKEPVLGGVGLEWVWPQARRWECTPPGTGVDA